MCAFAAAVTAWIGCAGAASCGLISTTRLRPPFLAALSAPSARWNSALRSQSMSSLEAAPMLTVLATRVPSSTAADSAKAKRIFSAVTPAVARSAPRQDRGELLAAQPADDAAGLEPLRHHAGKELQHAVAEAVSEGVVDLLEVVEVEHEHGKGVPL